MSLSISPEFVHTLARALGWTLLHSLWQGALLAGLVALVLGFLPARYPRARHEVCMLGLLLFLAASLGTWWRLWPAVTPRNLAKVEQSQTASEMEARAQPAPGTAGSVAAGDSARATAGAFESQHLERGIPWLAAVWGAGVMLLSLRQVFGWRRLRRWRRESGPAGVELQRSFARLSERIGRRAGVVLRVSAEVATPVLAGLLKPAVILPARLLTGLKAAEIEALLAHELAHFARRDGWAHLLQIALETLFFYHPAVWWIGSCARQEREKAADDLALELCGDRRAYAGALAQLAEIQMGEVPAPAATGGHLLARIERILQLPTAARRASRWSVGVPLLFAALAVALFIGIESRPARAAEQDPAKSIAQSREELVRRIYLDAAGEPPTPEQVRALVKSTDPEKFTKLVKDLPRPDLTKGETVATPEGRRQLARRLYLDLTGELPSPEETEAFANESGPKAYEKLVEKLTSIMRGDGASKRPAADGHQISQSARSTDDEAPEAKRLTLSMKMQELRAKTDQMRAEVDRLQERMAKQQHEAVELMSHVNDPSLIPGIRRLLDQPNLAASTRQFLVELVAQLEHRVDVAKGAAPNPAQALVDANRAAARQRGAEDTKRYSDEQLREIESLYQVANAKGIRTPEARASLTQLLEKYDKANRTGCVLLYMGQGSEGDERLQQLTRAVEKHSDCFYFDGCQVGGYGRYVLGLTHWQRGDKEKARAVFQEIKTTYTDATDHRGRPMVELVTAAEAEWGK